MLTTALGREACILQGEPLSEFQTMGWELASVLSRSGGATRFNTNGTLDRCCEDTLHQLRRLLDPHSVSMRHNVSRVREVR